MKTTLFNLHEILIEDKSLIIEFYAGDIFDIYSDILLLSAFKNDFYPSPNTAWEGLYQRLDLDFGFGVLPEKERISENILSFHTPENNYFGNLAAIEMSDYTKKSNFTKATLTRRYTELWSFLEKFPAESDESISMILLGTGNQGLSYDESITELFKTIFKLKDTRLNTIRVFANNFESIGVINLKLNEILNRNSFMHTALLEAALEELNEIFKTSLSELSKEYCGEIKTLSELENSSLDTFGWQGRLFAEAVSSKFLDIYKVLPVDDKLESKLKIIFYGLKEDHHLYILSYLRLLQSYGNQSDHINYPKLNHQDVAAIIIAIVRIIDFYEFKIKTV